ncbi:SPOR domain-containing protein [Priestia megaterium]|uniref:SPOR domain-containing protein n=1 Tax=Priestia megaterium TaxID=1404 RepID=UPI0036389F25
MNTVRKEISFYNIRLIFLGLGHTRKFVGAFSDEKNAKALAEKAKKAGFNVTLK